MKATRRAVSRVGRWLARRYDLELGIEPGDYLIGCDQARQLLSTSEPQPRTGVIALEEGDGTLWLGLYLDPDDQANAGTIVEETSHLLCLAWHAGHGRAVSRLALEIQAEVDRFLYARERGADPLAHFQRFHFASWLDAESLERYATAHQVAGRYCGRLLRHFPRPGDTPALLGELRRFYRAPLEAKLRQAA